MHQICTDLGDEHVSLDSIVANLDSGDWLRPTPAPGWTIADQISHLWFFDQRALLAATDVEAFVADMQLLISGSGGVEASVIPGRAISSGELLESWRADRIRLLDAASSMDPAARIPWYGPSMSARSFVTARLMETWAHGQDIADALSLVRVPTRRLKHIAHLGVRARPFSYRLNGRELPDGDVAVDLTAPDGSVWHWGDSADGSPSVTGSALDFCLVVTQRRHWTDTDLCVVGDQAVEWISIAQAFAGQPGGGRLPGQFAAG